MVIDCMSHAGRQRAVAAALFACLLLAPESTAQQTGTINGVVTTRAAAPRPLRVTFDQRVCGDEVPDESIVVSATGGVAHAVVTVAGVRAAQAPAGVKVMNEKCRFTPRVQIARPNATVTTGSADPVLHTTNAVMDDGKGLFNVAVPVPGLEIAKPLNGPGLVRVLCNTHPWMRGYIVVTEDMAAVTSADGSFTLRDVPPGTYELRVWHESLKAAPQTVTVTAGRGATVNFELK
jgi:plastocyanin